ncbi:hypothetical protein CR513_02181, partial [Mucuna pruriens]
MQPIQQSSLEELVKKMTMNNIQLQENMSATMQDLQTRIGQLATSVNQLQSKDFGQVPSQTIHSPQENMSDITMRSGKELPQQQSKLPEDVTLEVLRWMRRRLPQILSTLREKIHWKLNPVRPFTMSKMDSKPLPLHHLELDLSLLIGGLVGLLKLLSKPILLGDFDNDKATNLTTFFEKFTLLHVPRKQNERADLKDVLPQNLDSATKVKRQAAKYTLISKHLYKIVFSFLLLRCLDIKEAKYVMREVHKRGDELWQVRSPRLIFTKLYQRHYTWSCHHGPSISKGSTS